MISSNGKSRSSGIELTDNFEMKNGAALLEPPLLLFFSYQNFSFCLSGSQYVRIEEGIRKWCFEQFLIQIVSVEMEDSLNDGKRN